MSELLARLALLLALLLARVVAELATTAPPPCLPTHCATAAACIDNCGNYTERCCPG